MWQLKWITRNFRQFVILTIVRFTAPSRRRNAFSRRPHVKTAAKQRTCWAQWWNEHMDTSWQSIRSVRHLTVKSNVCRLHKACNGISQCNSIANKRFELTSLMYNHMRDQIANRYTHLYFVGKEYYSILGVHFQHYFHIMSPLGHNEYTQTYASAWFHAKVADTCRVYIDMGYR